MTDTRYRHRRTSNPSTPFPNPIEPGEIAVNTANRQIAVGDAGAATGAPLQLIALRFFSTQAAYVANDMVVQAGVVYRAKGTISPGAFNPTQWDMLTGAVDPQYVETAGDVMTGMLTLPATAPSSGNHATNKTYVDTRDNVALAAASAAQGTADAAATSANNRVLKAGDVMTGMLTLPVTAPSIGEHATNKTYVDGAIAAKASVVVSPTPPVGVPDNTLWFENDSGKLFLKYNDGTGATQWVEQVPNNSAAVSNDVSYLPQVLAVSEATQARKNVYAAPFDAIGWSGLQINGGFELNQEGLTAAVHGGAFADGWKLLKTGTMVVSGQTVLAAVFPVGLPAVGLISVGTAQASLAAGDFIGMYQPIEGYRVSRLAWGTANAQPITLGFWSRHIRTGLYSGTIRNGATDRSYAFTYTHAVADTPQYNTITIPGCTDGVWPTTNQVGIYLAFSNGCGTTLTAPSANAWVTGSYLAAPGQVNGVTATSDIFRIGGVGVFPGSEAPSAARSALIMRPYADELPVCQRYWSQLGDTSIGVTLTFQGSAVTAGFNISTTYKLPVTMRAKPTIALTGTWTQVNTGTVNYYADPGSVGVQLLPPAAGAFHWYGNGGRLTADARL